MRSDRYMMSSYIMTSNAPEVATSTAEFKLLGSTPVHTDCFSAPPPDSLTLEVVSQWHCSLPELQLDYVRVIQRAHVDTLLCAVFLVEWQSLMPEFYSQRQGRGKSTQATKTTRSDLLYSQSIVCPQLRFGSDCIARVRCLYLQAP